MAPTIHIIRHAQGLHNLNSEDHNLQDPILTPYGVEQCESLSKLFPNMDSIDLIVSSPLRRALYTALHTFAPIQSSKKLKVVANPLFQEWTDIPCDMPLSTSSLCQEFADAPVDLSLLTGPWNVKAGLFAIDKDAIEGRAREARRWLSERKEGNVVVVTHGGFVHYLTENWEGFDEMRGTGWENMEYRSYQMEQGGDGGMRLVEMEESRRRRV